MEKICDNKSVGVVLQNNAGEYLLINRARFPYGWSSVAGHVDEHGNQEQTAITEVDEEVGITIGVKSLQKVVDSLRVDNQCRRPNGEYHDWTVFRANVSDSTRITLKPDEVRGAGWFTPAEIQQLARQSAKTPATNKNSLALEAIWQYFFERLEII